MEEPVLRCHVRRRATTRAASRAIHAALVLKRAEFCEKVISSLRRPRQGERLRTKQRLALECILDADLLLIDEGTMLRAGEADSEGVRTRAAARLHRHVAVPGQLRLVRPRAAWRRPQRHRRAPHHELENAQRP